jgi:hypothetical protein
MAIHNNVINPALAKQLFRKSEMLKRKRGGMPASIESFPRVVNTITGLWRFAEGLQHLQRLMMVEGDRSRTGFPLETQEELMFLHQLLIEQSQILTLRGEKIGAKPPPGTKFTQGIKNPR